MEIKRVDIKIEKIVHTKRKTIALQVTDNATLIVRAPFNVSDKTIKRIIQKRKNWINDKKKTIEARDPKYSPKEFVSGEGFLYLGRSYLLEIVDEQDVPLQFKNRFYLSRDALSQARNVFIEWYKKTAYQKIIERVEWYAMKKGYKCNRIHITNAQKRWGSCSASRNLNFPWRLIMAPLFVLDYVIIHELIHLEEKNHTKQFWSKVKILMPHYKKGQDWLQQKGYLLRL